MAEPDQNASSFNALFQPFMEQWVANVNQANEATQKLFGALASSSDPRVWRRQWVDALSKSADVYLRSPPFLRMMKAQIEALSNARAGCQPAAGSSGSGGDAFAVPARQLSRMLQTHLKELEERVQAIENRVDQPATTGGWDQFLKNQPVPTGAADARVGATQHEVVYQKGPLRLLRYRSDKARFHEPVLICFALVNRPYILDLQGDRSVVRQLLARGFDVYLIDWGSPAPSDHHLRLQDYVCRFLGNLSTVVCKLADAPKLNLLGYCMGGTMSTMFTALYPERVRNLILMATPIDFGDAGGLLHLWAQKGQFDVDKLVDTYGNCPGEFLQYCFQLMKPVQNFVEKYQNFWDRLDDRGFLENFFAMERWANDSIPVAGETFREFVKQLYQQNRLVKGEMMLGGRPVKLGAISCPVLLLVAEFDHLVPPESTLALARHVPSAEIESLSVPAGHIGLAVSSKAHRDLWPQATDWIARHSTNRL